MDHPVARFIGTIIGLILGAFIFCGGLALVGFAFVVMLGWGVASLSPLHHSEFVEHTRWFAYLIIAVLWVPILISIWRVVLMTMDHLSTHR